MLEKIKDLIKRQEQSIKIRPLRHLAITMHGLEDWSKKHKKPVEEAYKKGFENLKEIIKLQLDSNIPILTIYLLPEKQKKEEDYELFLKEFVSFFEYLRDSEEMQQNKVKISALGKWYDIPGSAVEILKDVHACLQGPRNIPGKPGQQDSR